METIKRIYVKIYGNDRIKSEIFSWSNMTDEELFMCARNFADGLVCGLELTGISFNRPYVQQLDGFWWETRGGLRIQIENEAEKIVCTEKDV